MSQQKPTHDADGAGSFNVLKKRIENKDLIMK